MARRRPNSVRLRSGAQLTPVHVLELLTGSDMFNEGFRLDEDGRAAAWAVMRNPLVGYWSRSPGWEDFAGSHLAADIESLGGPPGPGFRPWAWWRYDRPEHRRCLNADDSTVRAELLARHYPGHPRGDLYWGTGAQGAFIHQSDVVPEWESQPAYLDRLGLLLPGERERIPADAWAPTTDPFEEADNRKSRVAA